MGRNPLGERQLKAQCKRWRRKTNRSLGRHGAAATIKRFEADFSPAIPELAWQGMAAARRVGIVADSVSGGDAVVTAIVQWAVLRDIGHPATIVASGDAWSVEVSDAVVSPKRLNLRPPVVPTVFAVPTPDDDWPPLELCPPIEEVTWLDERLVGELPVLAGLDDFDDFDHVHLVDEVDLPDETPKVRSA